jgi:hypothetical protein
VSRDHLNALALDHGFAEECFRLKKPDLKSSKGPSWLLHIHFEDNKILRLVSKLQNHPRPKTSVRFSNNKAEKTRSNAWMHLFAVLHPCFVELQVGIRWRN